ncbi:MAG: CRISPR-associated endonuclease Cas2 [Fibrobacteraceae bacterium]|nr:CRISPR-associated endonuclease Cas2 [Fibrobacteraceae bacterium]
MKYVIAFDISNNRRRNAVAKACLAVGFRVQRSVFECNLLADAYTELVGKIEAIVNAEKDTVRLYPLDKTCDESMEIIGRGKRIESAGFKVI